MTVVVTLSLDCSTMSTNRSIVQDKVEVEFALLIAKRNALAKAREGP